MSDIPPLVDVRWLSAAGTRVPLRIVDSRWSATGGSGRARYDEGHIPGAVFVDLDRDLSRPGGPGRHPFPSEEAFAGTLARLGIGPRTHVVVYDDSTGSVAARLWFMLRAHGHEAASVLDGGFKAWTEAGLPLTKDVPRIAPAALMPLELDRSRLADRAQVENRGRSVLLDARAPERYRGETEPLDPRAGHIPGARNAPYMQNLGPGGHFRPPEELRRLYQAYGDDVICSCGSGVTACHDILALELAGLPPARLYVGSWSDWCSDPDRPIATGPEPG
jgi:thiosulfate/3-mercaptopyruvate sulfurtransferase